VPWPASLLPRTYFPSHGQNRMASEGDLRGARAAFFSLNCNNLHFLLQNRYGWMNRFIERNDTVVEIGAGAGFASQFITGKLIMAEILPYSWIDLCTDGLNLPFAVDSIDVVICANVLHHFSSPLKFVRELHGSLKPDGRLLLFEPNPSFLFLLALRMMRHEGWSFDVDVFDPAAHANDPGDPWSGNNAVSQLMFRDHRVFQEHVPGFEIVHDKFVECLMFPLSGGVTAKTKTIELPMKVLRIIDWFDRKLCRLSPQIFAMGRALVLRKRGV
jgi:SAM-dependent methyltransferase